VPGKTIGDRTLELERLTALLEERLENLRQQADRVPEMELRITAIDERFETVRRDLGRMETNFADAAGKVQEINEKQLTLQHVDPASFRERLKELEVKIEHLEKQRSEQRGKNWAIALAVVSALIGSVFTILTQFLSKYLPLK